MIGIGFALRGTLTAPIDLEREAFIDLLRERWLAQGERFRAAEAADAADQLFSHLGEVVSGARLGEAAVRAVGGAMPAPVLIARFRQIADGIAQRSVDVPAATRETLERIASLGIPAAILCNGWSRIAQREAACVGFTGRVLVSEDIGVEKPEPMAFESLTKAIGLPAERIWYVGNDPVRDINGAATAGLDAVWLNPSGGEYPPGLQPPVLTIRRLEDLLPPLCEEYTRSLLSLRHVMRTALEWREGHYVPPIERW